MAELGFENASCMAADVTRSDDVKTYFAETVSRWGKVDVLFSNAGVIAPLADFPEDVFDSVYAVHVKGAFLAWKYGIPNMNEAVASLLHPVLPVYAVTLVS